jgi:hypothetical protein
LVQVARVLGVTTTTLYRVLLNSCPMIEGERKVVSKRTKARKAAARRGRPTVLTRSNSIKPAA